MKYLYVGALAEVERAALTAIGECAAQRFGMQVREIALPSIDFAFDAGRKQYASVAALELAARMCPPDAAKLLAVTERDLFVPVLTFVFGQAQLGGRAAIVSLARLRQEFYGLPANPPVFLERARKEALHELGHTFGLVHCATETCAMSLATGVRHIDSKEAAFCTPCGARLVRHQVNS